MYNNDYIKDLNFQKLDGYIMANSSPSYPNEMIPIKYSTQFQLLHDYGDRLQYSCKFILNFSQTDIDISQYTDLRDFAEKELQTIIPIFIITDNSRVIQNTPIQLIDADNNSINMTNIEPYLAMCNMVSENSYLDLGDKLRLEKDPTIDTDNPSSTPGFGIFQYGGIQHHWCLINGKFIDTYSKVIYDVINNATLSENIVPSSFGTLEGFRFCETDYTIEELTVESVTGDLDQVISSSFIDEQKITYKIPVTKTLPSLGSEETYLFKDYENSGELYFSQASNLDEFKPLTQVYEDGIILKVSFTIQHMDNPGDTEPIASITLAGVTIYSNGQWNNSGTSQTIYPGDNAIVYALFPAINDSYTGEDLDHVINIINVGMTIITSSGYMPPCKMSISYSDEIQTHSYDMMILHE